MPTHWLEKTNLSFNSLLLLEQVQITWMPGWAPEKELALALKANPAVEWFFRHKSPELNDWLDRVMAQAPLKLPDDPAIVREAELAVMNTLDDWLVYVLDPSIYDTQPFLNWDSRELTSLTDFHDRLVLDIGSGTGRLAFSAAAQAKTIWAVEPVGNLRHYIRNKARRSGVQNLFAVDGLMTAIPFPDGFADITISGHVYGDNPEAEHIEMERVTRPGGMVIFCPGNNDVDNPAHACLVESGYQWSRFEEPEDGTKRKYWKTIS